MSISKEEIQLTATQAFLNFSEEEIEALSPIFNKMEEYGQQLQAVDTEGVDRMIYASNNKNVMRADVADSTVTRDEVLKNTPDHENGLIRVPVILEDGEGNA